MVTNSRYLSQIGNVLLLCKHCTTKLAVVCKARTRYYKFHLFYFIFLVFILGLFSKGNGSLQIYHNYATFKILLFTLYMSFFS
jgi:hypothetical protein